MNRFQYWLDQFDHTTTNFFLISLLIFSAELKMDVLREREVKDSLERQLTEEQKLRSEHNNKKFNFDKSTTTSQLLMPRHVRQINFQMCF